MGAVAKPGSCIRGLLRFCTPLVLFTLILSTCVAATFVMLIIGNYAPADRSLQPPTTSFASLEAMRGDDRLDAETLENEEDASAINPFPFLFFSQSDVTKMRDALDTTQIDLRQRLEDYAKYAVSSANIADTTTGAYSDIPLGYPCSYAKRMHNGILHDLSDLSMAVLLFGSEATEELAFQWMDCITDFTNIHLVVSSKNWELSRRLLEMTTAFDLLYPKMSKDQRTSYSRYLHKLGSHLYSDASSLAWGNAFLSIETVTAYTSLYSSSLVLKRYSQDSHQSRTYKRWRDTAGKALDRTLVLLNTVYPDGSLPGGNYAGSSLSCMMVHYLMLALQHGGKEVSHIKASKWLKRHLSYLLYTTFPGGTHSLTLGSDVANSTWTCGPQAQLLFLEKFFEHDGKAAALANMITESMVNSSLIMKGDVVPKRNHSPLYLEALFHDLPRRSSSSDSPPSISGPKAKHFPYAGLAVYGHAFQPHLSTSAALYGSGLYPTVLESLLDSRKLSGLRWKSMSSSVHRPAAGSFVFYPRGQPFVTMVPTISRLKESKLDNTLTFDPPPSKHAMECNKISQEIGQSGECSPGFDVRYYSLARAQRSPSENITLIANHKHAPFWSVDLTGAYNKNLAKHIRRTAVVLSKDVMILIDDVTPSQYTTHDQHINAYFYNDQISWRTVGFKGAAVGRHRMYFTTDLKSKGGMHATTGSVVQEERDSIVTANYVRVTTSLKKALHSKQSRFINVYLFAGEASLATGVNILCSSRNWIGIEIQMDNGRPVVYSISVKKMLNSKDDLVMLHPSNPCKPDLMNNGLALSLLQRGSISIIGKEAYMMEKRVSIVVHQSRHLLYCGIPKCGVSRWRRLIRRDLGLPNWYDEAAHNPDTNGLTYISDFKTTSATSILNDAAYTSFVIVRSPFSRALSAWLDKHDNPVFKLPQTFAEFVKMLYKKRHKASEFEFHYRPMVNYCGIKEGVPYDFVGKMETIGDWGPGFAEKIGLSELTSKNDWHGSFFPNPNDGLLHNHHAQAKLNKYYTKELMQMIATVYAADFKTFKYDPNVLQ